VRALVVAVTAVVPFLASCGASTSADTLNASALACKYGEAIPDDPTPYVQGPAAQPGPPTEAFAQAKRLFDAERWLEAIGALQRVVNDTSGDDEGNRQIAEFELAVSYYRAHQMGLAMDIFEAIGRNPSHAKHQQTELWLGKMALEPTTTVRAVDVLYLYTDRESALLDNQEQRDMLYVIQLARARAAYRKGRYDEALTILLHVRTYAPIRTLADGCAAFAAAARGKAR